MSGEDGNEEFYRQLQLQQQYEAEPGGEGEADPFTYVDPADGAAYEWDREKKAWFPKAKPRQLALPPSVTQPAAFCSFVVKSRRLAFLLGCESTIAQARHEVTVIFVDTNKSLLTLTCVGFFVMGAEVICIFLLGVKK